MTTLWTSVAIVTAVVVSSLLWALYRRRSGEPAERLNYDIAVYKDQLSELDRDLARGLISETEAQSARGEVERRILAIADSAESSKAAASAPRGANAIAAVIVTMAVPALSFALYAHLGSPEYPNTPYAARDIAAEQARQQRLKEAGEMAGLIEKLAQRMEENPNNLQGWLLLGRTYLTMEREEDAVAALRRAADLAPEDPAVATELAEALVITNDNRVGAEARTILNGVLSRDARSPRARYYLALADAQAGKLKDALQGWTDLLAVSPHDAPWRATVGESIRRAAQDIKVDPATLKPSLAAKLLGPGKPSKPNTATTSAPLSSPGPSREDMKAASQMSAGDRTEMIKGMVQRLADRLEEKPNDLAGWKRLAQAYRVLGETKKAKEAEARIRALQ